LGDLEILEARVQMVEEKITRVDQIDRDVSDLKNETAHLSERVDRTNSLMTQLSTKIEIYQEQHGEMKEDINKNTEATNQLKVELASLPLNIIRKAIKPILWALLGFTTVLVVVASLFFGWAISSHPDLIKTLFGI